MKTRLQSSCQHVLSVKLEKSAGWGYCGFAQGVREGPDMEVFSRYG
jgi:hypothetical protein